MSTRADDIAGSTSVEDWQAVRADADIQFAPLTPPKAEPPPEWLEALARFLRNLLQPLGEALGMSWPAVKAVLIALAALGALWLVWRLALQPLLARRQAGAAEEQPWAPSRDAAVNLLADADRLAAAGRFDEATHLLLQRSVEDIAAARPQWLQPASTAREIAVLPMLPAAARAAFATIATRVERSRFARRALDLADWQSARAAYAEFALQEFAPGSTWA